MQVSLQLSFWMGRAGLLPLGATCGHSQAHLMCATRKHDARSKRRWDGLCECLRTALNTPVTPLAASCFLSMSIRVRLR